MLVFCCVSKALLTILDSIENQQLQELVMGAKDGALVLMKEATSLE